MADQSHYIYVYVIALVAVKFGINTMSVMYVYWKWGKFHETNPSEITHFRYNKSGIYPKFSLQYPCYSILIPYSLTFVGVSMYIHHVQIALLKHMSHYVTGTTL